METPPKEEAASDDEGHGKRSGPEEQFDPSFMPRIGAQGSNDEQVVTPAHQGNRCKVTSEQSENGLDQSL